MVPVVLPALVVGMVPNGVAVDVEAVLGTVDGIGIGVAVMEGGDGAGKAGGVGAGIVEPGIVDMNEVAGWAESARIGTAVPPVVEVEEVVGIADIIGAADNDVVAPVVPPVADTEVAGTAKVAGAICPDGVEQVTTVPGVVGLEASGRGASVVTGTPGWVAAENGLGPLSGEDSIVPGVDERPMAVVPMVETCARLASQPNSRAIAVNSKRSIAVASSGRSSLSASYAPRPCCLPPGSPSD